MTTEPSDAPLVWIDCEMTGLDTTNDVILQVYCFVTDASLTLLEPNGWGAVVHHPDATLSAMGEWCTRTHASTGLTAAVRASQTSPADASASLLRYIQSLVPEPRTALLAGNSVHADKAFLASPPYDAVLAHLHYRILDVSSIKEAARRWAPPEMLRDAPRKKGLHEAKEDILESIEEARFYKERFFASSR
ncbi:MAG: hypothetical protein M4579_006756 [Chaenotheca gracillima]|nr:MAG: hypothetical protein M4579_006756 [Chaenotheca gracillima]